MLYRNLLLLLFASAIFSCGVPEKTDKGLSDSGWEFDRIQQDTILFKNGKYFKTNLFDLRFMGQLANPAKAPYLIYSGRDCSECDANISLYVHSPDDGLLDVSNGQNRYVYPGKVMHYETGELIYESSCYYGEVLDGIKGVIWYITDHGETDNIYHHTFLLNGNGTELQDTLWKSIKTLSETEALFRTGKCKEIAGETFTSEP